MTNTPAPVTDHNTTLAAMVPTVPSGERPGLWRGGGEPGSGCICAMQELSWLDGEKEITAFPMGVDTFLALLVQEVNDNQCTHRNPETREVCGDCSATIRALATRTRYTYLPDEELTCTIYLAIAERLGANEGGIRRDRPHFVAREILEQLAAQQINLDSVHTIIDWWCDYVRVRTGRIVGISRTDEAVR